MNDRDKLVAILNELEKDYHMGNISKEKYIDLCERYEHKIKTIDASNRIRSMQGRENYSSNSRGNGRNPKLNQNKQEYNPRVNNYKNRNSRNYNSQRDHYKKGEFQRFEERHPRVQSRRPIRDSHNSRREFTDQKKSKGGAIAIGAIFIIVLLVAFGAGIATGIFNMGLDGSSNGFSELVGAGASINDTAFPIVKEDIKHTYNSSSYYKSNVISYSSSGGSDSGGSGSGGSSSGGSDE